GALGHVVGGDGHVLDLDAGVFLELLGNCLVLVHGRAQVTQGDLLLGNGRRETAGQDARQAGGALQQAAARQGAWLDVGGIGHGYSLVAGEEGQREVGRLQVARTWAWAGFQLRSTRLPMAQGCSTKAASDSITDTPR